MDSSKEEFKAKMEVLKKRKVYLEGKLVYMEENESVTKVIEEYISGALRGLKEYGVTKNISEYKNFIKTLLKKL